MKKKKMRQYKKTLKCYHSLQKTHCSISNMIYMASNEN
jgi:hypothetical protein